MAVEGVPPSWGQEDQAKNLWIVTSLIAFWASKTMEEARRVGFDWAKPECVFPLHRPSHEQGVETPENPTQTPAGTSRSQTAFLPAKFGKHFCGRDC